ncbi:hypothetical protein GNP80_15160 [Aliivibrio fischeri]|uniref:hypothetical protein n=1 Tax=Aliivibrio fischeri TaxID=668 RepID=UPI0012DAECC3|nr:hypothetical protein [Aliivibrio fischeri]MUK93769.1 hypothetical protein [Aliivibrio fischeri]
MDSVFFSGSISIKTLPERVKQSLDIIKNEGKYRILVGDANGVDALIQKYCAKIGLTNVTIYTIGDTPRNQEAHFKVEYVKVPEGIRNGRQRQTVKDEKMTFDSNISYVIWDEQSQGSFTNIIRALKNDKKVRVFSSKNNSPLNNIDIDSISKIYFNSNGLAAKDLLDELFKKGIKEFNNVRQLNSYLVDNKYIEKSDLSPNTYKTLDTTFATDAFYRGKHNGVKFRFELVQVLVNKFQLKNKTGSYGDMRG